MQSRSLASVSQGGGLEDFFLQFQELAMVRANPRWYIEASLQDGEDLVLIRPPLSLILQIKSVDSVNQLGGRERSCQSRMAHRFLHTRPEGLHVEARRKWAVAKRSD